jgi:hypothetical protein
MPQKPDEPKITFPGGANPPSPSPLLDQYKTYVADLGNIGVRYTAAQTFYFTLVSALIGVLALKDSGQPIAKYVDVKFVLVMSFIAAICYVWRETLLFYQLLFRAKFETIREIEERGLFTVYGAETQRLAAGKAKFPSLIDSEVRIPLGVMCIAILLAIASAGYLICSS